MASEGEMKEVLYYKYCRTCKHKDLEETETPCNECLAEPLNTNSQKPTKWEKK